MKTITINNQDNSKYDICINNNLLNKDLWQDELSANYNLVIITDSNVASLHAEKLANLLQAEIIIIPAGEIHKTRTQKIYIEDRLQELSAGRDTCIIAVGGGVITDIAGFVAATYCRGVPVVYCPTSLLAMVDASIGGKTAVNTPYGKNMIGAFKTPCKVIIDLTTLKTLDKHNFIYGAAEMIKHALLSGMQATLDINDQIDSVINGDLTTIQPLITTSIKIKQSIVTQDMHDTNIRQCLNLGHTIAHGIEAASNYEIPHGSAVLQGLIVESIIANKLNILCQQDLDLITKLCLRCLKSCSCFAKKDIPNIIRKLHLDKKNINKQPAFVLLESIGKVYCNNTYTTLVDQQTIEYALNACTQNNTKQETLVC
jgi:3-dehydroquinate synthase